MGEHSGELGTLLLECRPELFELLVIDACLPTLLIREKDLLRPEIPDPGKLLVRELFNTQRMLGCAADVDLGAFGVELCFDRCKRKDCL